MYCAASAPPSVTAVIDSPDKDPHEYEADAQTQLALSKARLVIENGGGYDDFVDTMAARLASFDKTSLASVKAMVNRATLPPDADLVASYGEFAHSLTLPGFLSRAAGFAALAAQAGPDLEYRLGEYLGMANQQA